MYILGYSGHAYVVIDAINSSNKKIMGYFDKSESQLNPYNISYLGFEHDVNVSEIVDKNPVFPAIGDNQIRKKAHAFIISNKLNQTIVKHSSAIVSNHVSIGESTLIAPNATINSGCKIGEACIINTGAIIEHECTIGDYTHIAPGAILTGNVTVGRSSFIGAGAIIKPGVKIGNHVTIGAGTVVLKDISDNETWVGNPARILK